MVIITSRNAKKVLFWFCMCSSLVITTYLGCVRWIRWVLPLGCKKTSGSDPLVFLRPKRIWKDTADWKINRLASMQADPLDFFSSANTPRKKIRRVGGKQAEPGVSSGFWIHRKPSYICPWQGVKKLAQKPTSLKNALNTKTRSVVRLGIESPLQRCSTEDAIAASSSTSSDRDTIAQRSSNVDDVV